MPEPDFGATLVLPSHHDAIPLARGYTRELVTLAHLPRRDLVETGDVEVVYLFLPLAQPGTPALCAAAEADGFFWSGMGPRYAKDGEMLCLQYLEVDLDFGLVQVAGPAGQQLLDYVGGRSGTREVGGGTVARCAARDWSEADLIACTSARHLDRDSERARQSG